MSTPSGTYWVFKRSARNWREFASARKYRVETGLTYDEARRCCERHNSSLSASEQRRGTKYEFQAGAPNK